MRSRSLNCNIANREILKRFYAKSLWEASGPKQDPMLAHEMEIAKILSLPIGDEKKGWILSKNLKRLIGFK